MKTTKLLILGTAVCLLSSSCKKEDGTKTTDFTAITTHYFDDKNALDPLSATQNGQNQYNDQLQFEMTDGYRKSQLAFFDKY